MNKLFYGDCLEVMNNIDSESIDLIYLDPPFNSNRAYHTIYKDSTGNFLPEQATAFCDIWELTVERLAAIERIPELMRDNGIDISIWDFWYAWMNALKQTQPRLLAYLSYMMERLIVMRRLLKSTGSIYVHCDPTASHYIKIIMDGIFGYKNFRNELIWWYDTGGYPKKDFARKHDVILRCTKTDNYIFNPQMSVKNETQRKRFEYAKKQGAKSTYRINSIYKHPHDVIQMHAINPKAKERLGYPTQKPLSLMNLIIKSSSNEGDVVLDPFCGCATTIAAAHELGRKWIGIDIAFHAIRRVVQMRLKDQYGLQEGQDYQVAGIPNTREGADDLWRRDPYQFQCWAVEMVGGFVTNKQSADGGIDGKIYFKPSPNSSKFDHMILEVKGGENVGIDVVRSLRGAMERRSAAMAGLILKKELRSTQKRNFINEMSGGGIFINTNSPECRC